MQDLSTVQDALGKYQSLDGAREFFTKLGYPTIEPLPWDLRPMLESIQRLVGSIHQLVNIGNQFRVFHVELKPNQIGQRGQILRQPIRRFLESFYKHYPQGENLFVFTPASPFKELVFVSPRRLVDHRDRSKVRLWLRILQVDRDQPYRTDLETLSKIRADGVRDPNTIWRRHEEAFSVQRVTEQFFQDYAAVFDRLRNCLKTNYPHRSARWAHDYTHQLLNRIMFLYFIARKGWLLGPNGQPDRNFMRHFWEAYRESGAKDKFHSEWLQVLFFEAFNNKWQNRAEYLRRFPEWLVHSLSQAPYLNGGLYTPRPDLDDPQVLVPDEDFALLFEKWTDGTFPGLFERYNFTVVETGRFDEEVAVDPEMLGTVYERLVNVTFEIGEGDPRGAAGIFYTPRVEIDLMCRLALVDWLSNQLGSDKKELLYQWVFAFSEEEKQEAEKAISRELWEQLHELVRRVRVCDPACGSGSFLVGMLLVLDDLQARCNAVLGRSETPYERRKRILQDQLYGVDVMEWAVRVAELRLWLQLVVETELQPPELHFRPLLPNLDLKLRPGDSLLQTVGALDLSPFRRSELSLPAHLKGRLTQLKGKKRRYFQGEEPGLTAKLLEQEEVRLFRDILSAKVHELDNRIKAKRKQMQVEQGSLPGMEKPHGEDEKRRQLEEEIATLEEERARHEKARDGLRSDEPPPFVWDLSFVEVFEDESPGFDIVIGNPPYVRQEKISDYLGRFERSRYLQQLNDSLRAIYPAFMRGRRISGRADYYVYFYLHGLSLLADRGTFCFITSNSWLDVDFGKDLQEFFLRHGHLKMVIDNRAKRSFAQADVNTVIVLAGSPERNRALDETEMRGRRVRFVAFRVPFEEALSPVLFSEIEDDGLYSPLAGFRVLKRPEFRAVLLDQWSLWEEGLEEADGERLVKARKYAGNKWGGKYLRAPDIFFTILEKGKDKLVRLGDIAEVHGYIHDNNTGKKYPSAPFLKSIMEASAILLTINSSGIIRYGVKPEGKSRMAAPILFARTFGDRLFALWNIHKEVLGKEFYKVIPKNMLSDRDMVALLNTSLAILQFEIFGSAALGGGALKFSRESIESFMLPPLSFSRVHKSFEQLVNRRIRSIFEELGFPLCRQRRCPHPEHPYEFVKPEELTLEQVRTASPDRFALDGMVFDVLGLTNEERLEVYRAVVELVKNRLVKARSV